MTNTSNYYQYLRARSRLGGLYRRYWLYPRLCRHISGSALDIGCGIGDLLAFRPGTLGVDINPLTVADCISRGLDARVMIVDTLPFENARFDTAVLDNVLEHIERPMPLLNETARVLKPSGTLLVGVPGLRGFGSDPDHKVPYDEHSLAECVTSHGFDLKSIFHTPLWKSEALNRKMRQYCIYGLFERR